MEASHIQSRWECGGGMVMCGPYLNRYFEPISVGIDYSWVQDRFPFFLFSLFFFLAAPRSLHEISVSRSGIAPRPQQ